MYFLYYFLLCKYIYICNIDSYLFICLLVNGNEYLLSLFESINLRLFRCNLNIIIKLNAAAIIMIPLSLIHNDLPFMYINKCVLIGHINP